MSNIIYLSDEDFFHLLEELENPRPPNEALKAAMKKHREKFPPEVKYEMHADGVKEVTCGFCSEPCKTDWCPTKDEE